MEDERSTITDFSPKSCIICQKRKSDQLSDAQGNGKKKLKHAAQIRHDNLDESYASAAERVWDVLSKDDEVHVKYHKECYKKFTNPGVLNKLKQKSNDVIDDIANSTCESISSDSMYPATQEINFTQCIFCQKDTKEHLRMIESESMLRTVQQLVEPEVLSSFNSEESSSARYHSCCLIKAKRIKEKENQTPALPDSAFDLLIKELRYSGSLGKVLKLCDVWTRYEELAVLEQCSIKASFSSRLSTFKEKLQEKVEDVFQFYRPMNLEVNERKTLLIPKLKAMKTVVQGQENIETAVPDPACQLDDNIRSLVHTALFIRGELLSTAGHTGLHVTRDDALKMIPQSLHLLLSIIIGGDDAVENHFEDQSNADQFEHIDDDGTDDEDGEDNEEDDDCVEDQHGGLDPVSSIAQDLIFAASNKKKLTPKHIGLGLTLHQYTRSRKLVTLFHRAGHCISYQQVLKIDTALAQMTLNNVDDKNGAVTPLNFACDSTRILHITADNVDIMTDTLDGRKTFHGTQMVGFQRGGKRTDEILRSISMGTSSKLIIPDALRDLIEPDFSENKPSPKFSTPLDLNWYVPSSSYSMELGNPATLSKLKDTVFGMTRVNGYLAGWSEFNRCRTEHKPEVSEIGYMPMILNEAHEYSTLNTILHRCISIGDKLGQKHIVLTTDQALYCKLMEIRWSNKLFQDRIVLRMGGLHLALNFLKVIGQHMAGTGLEEIWKQAGIMAEGSISKVMDGKAYAKGMRLHKLTFQAMWKLLTPMFQLYLEEQSSEKAQLYQQKVKNSFDLLQFFKKQEHLTLLNEFISQNADRNENFGIWWTYMDLIYILLMLTRGIRAGSWNEYLAALTEMLPYIARYDHGNYVRSLSVYIADMNQLPEEVETAFKAGDFTVLRSDHFFAQVDPDHAQEWVVGVCKSSGGIVGITQDQTTLQRWALSYHWRSEIAQNTCAMYGLSSNSQLKEETPSRRNRDLADEESLVGVMKSLDLFNGSQQLCNIVTKDQATDKIRDDLLNAKEKGAALVEELVANRLVVDENGNTSVSLYSKITKNSPATFADLYKVKSKVDPKKIVSADRDVLRRLIVSYEAGRGIDLQSILKHELLPVPISLAEMSGSLRKTDKSSIINLFTADLNCPRLLKADPKASRLIVDGKYILSSLGKPQHAKTFGDLSLEFNKVIAKYGSLYDKIDVIFDQIVESLVIPELDTWKKSPVRRKIENASVPLPNDWKNFTGLKHNLLDLYNFVSNQLTNYDFKEVNVATAGGFTDKKEESSDAVDTTLRIISHAISSATETVVVMSQDPDMLVLLITHFKNMSAANVWLLQGQKKDQKYIPIHEICSRLSNTEKDNLIAFHAITGCSSTSRLSTITKRHAWKIYQKDPSVLTGMIDETLTMSTIQKAEQFVVSLYKLDSSVKTADQGRFKLFGILSKPEALPPTSDALLLHIKRSYYQANFWMNAGAHETSKKDPKDYGWQLEAGKYKPQLMTLEAVPDSCTEIITCGCKTMCTSKLCKCSKTGICCTKLCKCSGSCMNTN